MCNIDEFFWHPDLRWYLEECRRVGISFTRSLGYQMVSEDFPSAGDDLRLTHRLGVRFPEYDKPAFFNPDLITDSGFKVGRHKYDPQGLVVEPEAVEILMLHYKYIGREYLQSRHAELQARFDTLYAADAENGPRHRRGGHYNPEITLTRFGNFLTNRAEIVPADQGPALARQRRSQRPVFPLKASQRNS